MHAKCLNQNKTQNKNPNKTRAPRPFFLAKKIEIGCDGLGRGTYPT